MISERPLVDPRAPGGRFAHAASHRRDDPEPLTSRSPYAFGGARGLPHALSA
jgi:hypothetical protein